MTDTSKLWKGAPLSASHSFRDQELDRYLDAWAKDRARGGAELPKTEVSEDKNHYSIKLELPGVAKDQLRVECHDQLLTVTGEKKEEKKEESKRLLLSELSYGAFARTFTLPSPIHAEGAQASYEHGVLEIKLPKSEVSKTKQVQIR